jgi:Recombination endonuclease VII
MHQQDDNNHPQLWNAGPVRIFARTHKANHNRSTCRHPGCTKLVRSAQGARYCEEHAVSIAYQLQQQGGVGAPTTRTCNCGRSFTVRKAIRSAAVEAWWEFCPHCHQESPIKLVRIRGHNVSADLVRRWLTQGSKLRCDICGKTLTRRHLGSSPVIDHDHTCCPAGNSCGNCVRGVVCQDCNTKLGHIEGIERAGLWHAFDHYLHG